MLKAYFQPSMLGPRDVSQLVALTEDPGSITARTRCLTAIVNSFSGCDTLGSRSSQALHALVHVEENAMHINDLKAEQPEGVCFNITELTLT